MTVRPGKTIGACTANSTFINTFSYKIYSLMTPIEFKELWMPDALNGWLEFDIAEIERSLLNNTTKDFLKVGFPDSAAPYVDFGWSVYGNRFLNIFDYYSNSDLDISTRNYWMFGSDGGGNPICFDISHNDRIVLLDHEQGFEMIATINNNIAEFAECLLLYKNFISRIQEENGEDAFFDQNITDAQFLELKEAFKQVNTNIFKESEFWRSEISVLKQ